MTQYLFKSKEEFTNTLTKKLQEFFNAPPSIVKKEIELNLIIYTLGAIYDFTDGKFCVFRNSEKHSHDEIIEHFRKFLKKEERINVYDSSKDGN